MVMYSTLDGKILIEFSSPTSFFKFLKWNGIVSALGEKFFPKILRVSSASLSVEVALPVGVISKHEFEEATYRRFLREMILSILMVDDAFTVSDFFFSVSANGESHLLIFPEFEERVEENRVETLLFLFLEKVTANTVGCNIDEEIDITLTSSGKLEEKVLPSIFEGLRVVVKKEYPKWVDTIEKILFLKTKNELLDVVTLPFFDAGENIIPFAISKIEINSLLIMRRIIERMRVRFCSLPVTCLLDALDFTIRDTSNFSHQILSSDEIDRRSEEVISLFVNKKNLHLLERVSFIPTLSPVYTILGDWEKRNQLLLVWYSSFIQNFEEYFTSPDEGKYFLSPSFSLKEEMTIHQFFNTPPPLEKRFVVDL